MKLREEQELAFHYKGQFNKVKKISKTSLALGINKLEDLTIINTVITN